jgi:hypothetical protein
MRNVEERMLIKYGISYDDDGWPDIKGIEDNDAISHQSILMLLMARTAWLKLKVDRLRSLV